MTTSPPDLAAPGFPDAQASDPQRLGWMQGFPPPPDKRVQFDDGSMWAFPRTRWSFSHMQALRPSVEVLRGPGAVAALAPALRDDLDAVPFTTLDGRALTWGDAFHANYTDGVAVLHEGKLVYERYAGALQPQGRHISFSVTKSFVGTLAAMLVHSGAIDPESLVPHYVPELKDSAYADASVRQVMDMTIGVAYSEVYSDPQADIWNYTRAGGFVPYPPGASGPRTLCDFLLGLRKEGAHGQAFAYKTVNTDVLAWVIRRVTGQSLADLMSSLLWSRLGAEHNAFMNVDSVGTEFGGGGLSTSLRDLARFGEALRQDGWFNGQQIIPAAVVADIRRGADPAHFAKAGYTTLPGWSYRNMWWVAHDDHGCFTARGVHGQVIWIDPKAKMVIARYASHPLAANVNLDPTSLPAYAALGRHLLR